MSTPNTTIGTQSAELHTEPPRYWLAHEKFWFRVFFIFFFVLVVPLDTSYYTQWFTTDWNNLHIRDIGSLSGSSFSPIKIVNPDRPGARDVGSIGESPSDFLKIRSEEGSFGLLSYINWALAFGIALILGSLWTVLDRRPRNYRVLYYFLITAVSYSLLIRLQGLTFSKVFPSQMPELALTQLNTPLGDFVAQKLYWIQFSFVPDYQRFAGWAELLIMLFLFFRPTRALGAALAVAMIGNIAFANHAYDGGIHLAASFYVLGGLFVLAAYLPGIWRLIIQEQDTVPSVYVYPFRKKWQRRFRFAFKTFVFLFFFVLSAYLHWHNYTYDSYKVPANPGLPGSRGVYDVTEFKVNGQTIPYSPLDSLRWQRVTFEKWSTLSFTVFNTFNIHGEAGRGKQFADIDRTYESAGTGGGRRHYYYEADTINSVLFLQNKNKLYRDKTLRLHYKRPTDEQIILWGTNEYQDSIYVVLDKKEEVYPLYEGSPQRLSVRPQ